MTREEYFQKLAYELGCRAAEQGMEKEAFIGMLGKGARVLWGQGQKLISGAGDAVKGSLGNAGIGVAKQFQKSSPRAYEWMRIAGKNVPRDAYSFGLLTGGINAVTADPGERLGAFGRGFAGGALGGAAWRGASNLASHAQRRMYQAAHGGKLFPRGGIYRKAQGSVFKPQSSRGVQRAAKKHEAGGGSWFTSPERWYNRFNAGAPGRIGAKAVLGTLPLAASIGASSYTPTFDKEPDALGMESGGNPYYDNIYMQ